MFLKSIIFFFILWKLSPSLEMYGLNIKGSIAISALTYFMIPSLASYFLGLKMMKFEDKRRRAEAHMRYAVISALQNKKDSARIRFKKTLNLIIKTSSISMKLNFVANFVNLGLAGMSFVIPFLFLLPSYLRGTILLGDVIKAAGAFGVFQVSINYLHYNFREVVRCMAAFGRLNKFSQLLK
jgi:putative ATP-binding cassette transporter